ncbi:ribonuclease H-like domain-containing protein [Tanacetum coccineum]
MNIKILSDEDCQGLPRSVLKGKSPYHLVFYKKPSLKHLRVFGCLCFATVLNNHDKFSSRAEKCVLVVYSSFKKRYKLFSLERKQFVISKDVNFFENVLPFKIKLSSKVNKSSQGLDHVNFFDEIVHEGPDTPNDDNNLNAQPRNKGSNSFANENEMDTSFENDFAISEGDIADIPNTKHIQNLDSQPLRRSERFSVFLNKYNEYVVDSKVNYGLKKYVDDIIVIGSDIHEIEKKYRLDLLSEFGLLTCKPSAIPLKHNLSISNEPTDTDLLIDNITEYQKLIGKLIYLTHTKPDIAYSVHCLCIHITKCINTSLEKFVDVDYAKCVAIIKIAAKLVFHERTKHLEIGIHFVRDKIISGVIATKKISSADQTSDVLTKVKFEFGQLFEG